MKCFRIGISKRARAWMEEEMTAKVWPGDELWISSEISNHVKSSMSPETALYFLGQWLLKSNHVQTGLQRMEAAGFAPSVSLGLSSHRQTRPRLFAQEWDAPPRHFLLCSLVAGCPGALCHDRGCKRWETLRYCMGWLDETWEVAENLLFPLTRTFRKATTGDFIS